METARKTVTVTFFGRELTFGGWKMVRAGKGDSHPFSWKGA